ncbi:hypothetical protein CRE_22645 [Caenorhabditis remanei]|uniref:F-box domain-containing protein n=1 Tax=Caenorhabditis remanei TaxID=31234 RepID=E3N8Q8_CAERE|nr:hypothetical protein CRE_22645 [Caenorhabditis remanei]
MPVELSYPGLKCVLEFLEANKRIHISSRCPRLKYIERCVPLYLNTLYFLQKGVKLNEITYEIEGDLLLGPSNPVFSRMYPTINFFKQVLRPVERRVQKGMQDYEIIRDLLEGLMGLRKNIRVDQLVLSHSTIIPVPSDFNVKIRNLNCDHVNPKYFLPLIDTSSFPLKGLSIRDPERLDQSIVQSSEKLVIFVDEEYPRNHLDYIDKLPNKSVITKFRSLNEDAYSNIIDYLLDKKQETGKCFMIIGNETRIMQAAIDLMKRYDGKMVKWNGTEFRSNLFCQYLKCTILNFSSNPNTNYISIPLNDDLVIAIYAVTYKDWFYQIVMKTMPIDSFIPAEEFSEVTTLLEIEDLENSRQNDEFTNPLLVIVFVQLFLILALIFFILFGCFSILYEFFTNPTQI